jgi:hypothetical protein
MTNPVTAPPNDNTNTAQVTTNTKATYTEWTRLNYKGIYHDNRRLLKHRAKNCECSVCYREIHKLPPMETQQEYNTSITKKKDERVIKKGEIPIMTFSKTIPPILVP